MENKSKRSEWNVQKSLTHPNAQLSINKINESSNPPWVHTELTECQDQKVIEVIN